MKTISVNIVTYNSERDIELCLKAVFQQEYPVNEVIVIDNDSKDSTRNILKSYASRITIAFNNNNEGFAKAHNQAIHLSSSDYCLILNPDVILNPDYLSILMQHVETHDRERIGSLTGKLVRKDNPKTVDSCGITMNKARRAFDLGSEESSDVWMKTQNVFGVSGAAALYNRKMIEEISYNGQFFDDLFFAYKEDVDVAWRAHLFGWKATCVPQAIGFHERGWKAGHRQQQSLFVRKLSYINRYKMILKNDKPLNLLQSILPLLYYEILSFGFILIREPRLLTAWITIIREWRNILAWRKFIHKN